MAAYNFEKAFFLAQTFLVMWTTAFSPFRVDASRPATRLSGGEVALLALYAFAALASWQLYGAGDFGCFYGTAAVLRDTGQYQAWCGAGANLNLPHVSAALIPLTLAPLPVAWTLWQLLNLGALAFVWRWLPATRKDLLIPMIALSPALLSQIAMAQIAALLAALVTASWVAGRGSRPYLAGALLGVAIALKPFLLPVAVWWAVSRAGRAAAVALSTAGACLAIGMALLTLDAYTLWLDAIRVAGWAHFNLNLSMFGAVSRLGLAGSPAPWVIACAVVAVVTGACTLARRNDAAWVAVLLASILISPFGWAYYELIVAAPLVGAALEDRGLMRTSAVLWLPPALAPGGVVLASVGLLLLWAVAVRRSCLSPRE